MLTPGWRRRVIVSAIMLLASVARLDAAPPVESLHNQFRKAEVQFEIGNWEVAADSFNKVLQQLNSRNERAISSELSQMRRRCLFCISSAKRRLSVRASKDRASKKAEIFALRKKAIRFAILYRDALEDLPDSDAVRAARFKNQLSILDDYSATDQFESAIQLVEKLLSAPSILKPTWIFQLRFRLATFCEQTAQDDKAVETWRYARADGERMLAQYKQTMSARDRVSLLARLVVICEALREANASQQFLREATAVFESDPQIETRKQQLLSEIAMRCWHRRDITTSESYAVRAAECKVEYLAKSHGPRQLVSVLTSLAKHHQRQQSFNQAIKLTHLVLQLHQVSRGENAEQTIDAKTWLGTLYGMVGDVKNARQWLSTAMRHREQQSEQSKLAQVLNNLAAVERSAGNHSQAKELFRRALTIREKLNDSQTDLATSLNNLGSAYMATNEYDEAIRLYRRVLALCRQSDSISSTIHSRALLNIATAYESQSQYDQAAQYLRRASKLNAKNFDAETLQIVDHYNALAALARKQGQLWKAHSYATAALDLCQANDQRQLPAAATAHNNLAIGYATWARSQYRQESMMYALAEDHWRQTLAIRQHHGHEALVARTINYLGMIAWWQNLTNEAHERFQRALDIQDRIQARPQDRYSTLCNLASVLHFRKQDEKAFYLLRQAIKLQDEPRSRTLGGEAGRAMHFSRFEQAYEKLVQWSLEAENFERAFEFAERSRNRTFLDQLGLAGIDLRTTLDPKQYRELLEQERRLRREMSELRNQLASISRNKDTKESLKKLAAELNRLRRKYSQVWTEIRDASPYYRRLLTQQSTLCSLEYFQDEVLDQEKLTLFYYLGVNRGYVLCIAHDDVALFSLRIPESVGQVLSSMMSDSGNTKDDPERGIVGTVESPKGPRGAATPKQNIRPIHGYLTRSRAERLVSWYVARIRNKNFSGERGIVGTVESNKGERVARPNTALGDILLPHGLRDLIAKRKPKSLIIVPDGPLHSLPFEALWLSSDKKSRFAIDELPPIAYAPSANVLVNLSEPNDAHYSAKEQLLTVGNPAYRRSDAVASTKSIRTQDAIRARNVRDAFLGFAGQLTPLPGTDIECRVVARNFTRNSKRTATQLLGKDATEFNVINAIQGKGYVHIAAHGIVDENYENLFGAIALTPPTAAPGDPREDGFLSYNEILRLPLTDCHLAVLSACRTNVGGRRKLESGTSLAQAFLAAGARRVIASHWNVSDSSTAEMMGALIDDISKSMTNGKVVDYATALQRARRKIKSQTQWAAPYYWAPFVLTGPATK